MKRSNQIVVFLILGLIAAGAATAVFGPDEPKYRDKHLGEWLDQLGHSDERKNQAAADAFEAMGESAVPCLIAALRTRDSAIKEQIELVARLQPWFNVSFGSAASTRAKAVKAFSILGPAAVGAIPALSEVLYDTENPNDVAETLGQIGPDAIPPLLKALNAEDPSVRCAALFGLDVSPFAPADIAETAVTRLTDENSTVRYYAARCLYHRPGFPKRAVPMLIAKLADDSGLVRRYAAHALGAYGSAAIDARTQLQEIASNPEEDRRTVGAAMNALTRIDQAGADGL